jgi:hypothetical protein
MESLPRLIVDGRAVLVGSLVHQFHYLSALDLARMVSHALWMPTFAGRELTLLGPRPYSVEDAISTYIRLADSTVKLSWRPSWLPRVGVALRRGSPSARLADVFACLAQIPEIPGSDNTDEVFDGPMTSLEAWAARVGLDRFEMALNS